MKTARILCLSAMLTIFMISFGGCESSYRTGGIYDVKVIDDKKTLSMLYGNVSFVGLEIERIETVGDLIFTFLTGPDDAMQFVEDDSGEWQVKLGNLPEGVDFGFKDVELVGSTYGFLRNTLIDTFRSIYWIQLRESYEGKGNIVLLTELPDSRMKVNSGAVLSDFEESADDNFEASMIGAWHHFHSSDGERTVIRFDEAGTGDVSTSNPGGFSSAAARTFDFILADKGVLSLRFGDGESEVLRVTERSPTHVHIETEGESDWFQDGVLTRIEQWSYEFDEAR